MNVTILNVRLISYRLIFYIISRRVLTDREYLHEATRKHNAITETKGAYSQEIFKTDVIKAVGSMGNIDVAESLKIFNYIL